METLKRWWQYLAGLAALVALAVVYLLSKRSTARTIERRVDLEIRSREADALAGEADAVRSRRVELEAEIEKLDSTPPRNTEALDASALADEYMRLRAGGREQ